MYMDSLLHVRVWNCGIARATATLQVMDRDSIQSIAVKFETTPSEIARINKKQTLTFSIFPGDVSC